MIIGKQSVSSKYQIRLSQDGVIKIKEIFSTYPNITIQVTINFLRNSFRGTTLHKHSYQTEIIVLN